MRALARALLASAALLAAAPAALAQVVPLDGVWFRVQLSAVGRSVDGGTLALEKDKVSAKAFLHLALGKTADGSGLVYEWQLWTKQDDTWSQSDTGLQPFVGNAAGDQLAIDLELDAQLGEGRFLVGRATLLFALKLNDEGAVKQATIRTLGGETIDGSDDGENLFVGSFRVKGHDVPVGKLPFEPV